MKVVYQACCGVDVHESFFVATIIKTTSGVGPSYHKKRFSTFNNSILAFKKWLLDNSCRDVCMESTGKYWGPCSTFWKTISTSPSPTPNGSGLSRGTRTISGIPNESGTCDIDSMIDSLIELYENAVQLLCTIPGIDRNSAVTVISEIGADMT